MSLHYTNAISHNVSGSRPCIYNLHNSPLLNKMCGRPPQYAPATCKLTFDLLTLKVVSKSRVMWATSPPIFSLPRPLCSRHRPDVHDRQTSDMHHRLVPPTLGVGHNEPVHTTNAHPQP